MISIITYTIDCALKIAQKEVQPPYIPNIDTGDPYVTSNFDVQFTQEPAVLTPDDP